MAVVVGALMGTGEGTGRAGEVEQVGVLRGTGWLLDETGKMLDGTGGKNSGTDRVLGGTDEGACVIGVVEYTRTGDR